MADCAARFFDSGEGEPAALALERRELIRSTGPRAYDGFTVEHFDIAKAI